MIPVGEKQIAKAVIVTGFIRGRRKTEYKHTNRIRDKD